MTQSNRDIAWDLLDQCIEQFIPEIREDRSQYDHKAFQEKYPEIVSKVLELFDFVWNNFPPPVELTKDEKIAFSEEIRSLFREKFKRNLRDRELSDNAFPIWIVRFAIHNRYFPRMAFIGSKQWKDFSETYGEYILEA